MNEKLLQYLWNFKVFTHFDFKDMDRKPIEILDFGKWNQDSGPDFTMAKIRTRDAEIVGNIELHVKSSDWIFHQHSGNPDFSNLILHVVFENDADIEEFQNRNIPTVELKNHIDQSTLGKYQQMLNTAEFIPCEKIFDAKKIPFQFAEEASLDKLNHKSLQIEESLKKLNNDFEAVLFHQLAYAFGLKVNATIFKEMAESFDFSVVRKISQNQNQLEALFYGSSNWLEKPLDEQMQRWRQEFDFLKGKFNLKNQFFNPKFLRLRPPNFPTIRLSQLANLYNQHPNLFSKIINSEKITDLRSLFTNLQASNYWDYRFNFGKNSPKSYQKTVSEDFINIVLLNAVLPMIFTYYKYQDEEITDRILEFYRQIPAEQNTVVSGFQRLGCKIENALQSQAMIHHFKNFCENKKCLNCGIGFQLLKS